MHPAITYALLGVCAGALVFGFWVDGRPEGSRLHRLRRWSILLQLGAVLGAYGVLRPGRGVDGHAALAEAAAAQRPVLLDMYSNY